MFVATSDLGRGLCRLPLSHAFCVLGKLRKFGEPKLLRSFHLFSEIERSLSSLQVQFSRKYLHVEQRFTGECDRSQTAGECTACSMVGFLLRGLSEFRITPALLLILDTSLSLSEQFRTRVGNTAAPTGRFCV